MAKGPKSEIVRHQPPKASEGQGWPEFLTEKQMTAIEKHVEKHVGKCDGVWHEIASDGVHLDILPAKPTKKHPFKTLVTMGMSAVPMHVPKGYPGPTRLELCVVLPPDWPTDEKGLKAKGNRNWWPVAGLKELGRLPCTFETFLDVGHTVPNGDPPEPFAASCKFVCWMVMPLLSLPEKFGLLSLPRFKVQFLQIIPLYEEEMNLKLAEGIDALLDRFEEAVLDPVLLCDPKRRNVCAPAKKRGGR